MLIVMVNTSKAVPSYARRSIDEALGTSCHFAKELAKTARRGFNPEEIARMKARDEWGFPPLSKGETLHKNAIRSQVTE